MLWKTEHELANYPNKMIAPILVKILMIFCPIAVQTVPDCCFVGLAMPDYRHRLQPMRPVSYDLIADCSRGFVFLEDNTEHLVLEFVRD